jgi:hypothetical protein
MTERAADDFDMIRKRINELNDKRPAVGGQVGEDGRSPPKTICDLCGATYIDDWSGCISACHGAIVLKGEKEARRLFDLAKRAKIRSGE